MFADTAIARYPLWVVRLTGFFMAILFLAAGLPSLFRLFSAGRDYFLHGINDPGQAALVGVSTFLLAEFLIILSTISARVFFTGWARAIFILPVGMGLAVALVGNWTVTQPVDTFGWLETVVPPLAVLVIAVVGEKLILDSISARHANERAFQQAHSEWRAAVTQQQADDDSAYRQALARWSVAVHDPQRADEWNQVYATALREKIKEVNAKGQGSTRRNELMAAMSAGHWRALVRREMAADRWYESIDEAEPEAAPAPVPFVQHQPQLALMTNGNGHHGAGKN